MPTYLWKNVETGEVVEEFRSMEHSHTPPDKPGTWERLYPLFGVGRVEGGGGSPARTSVNTDD